MLNFCVDIGQNEKFYANLPEHFIGRNNCRLKYTKFVS